MKIFVVVGTQEPFDRMVKTIDQWAAGNSSANIFGQISRAAYIPESFETTGFISPELFDIKFREADLIVSHAGMGTIISALQHSKPIIVMPRLAEFLEHRNDHQLATARSFGKLGFVKDVYNENELIEALNNADSMKAAPAIGSGASQELTGFLKTYVSTLK